MRVLLVTGKGGVGKTTTAAATAVAAARRGTKALLLSADAAHSLGDALALPVGPEPVEVEPGLWAAQVDVRGRAERSWRGVQEHLLAVLDALGVDPAVAEEVTGLPGAEEVLALLEVRDRARAGPWDLVVVDCAPTAEALRLLALPALLRGGLERAFPVERRVARAVGPALRPVLERALASAGLGGLLGAPAAPGGTADAADARDGVLDAATRLHAELLDVQELLSDPSTSVRLVLVPEAVVVAEARRTLTSLALHGYRVDGVVANRVLPRGQGAWVEGWARAQEEHLAEVEASCAPVPVRRVPHAAAEPVGLDALAALGEALLADDDPAAVPDLPPLLAVERDGEELVLVLAMPLARPQDLSLSRRGDDLLLDLAGDVAGRRVVALPSALRRCDVVGAVLREGQLRVRFRPDPERWRPL